MPCACSKCFAAYMLMYYAYVLCGKRYLHWFPIRRVSSICQESFENRGNYLDSWELGDTDVPKYKVQLTLIGFLFVSSAKQSHARSVEEAEDGIEEADDTSAWRGKRKRAGRAERQFAGRGRCCEKWELNGRSLNENNIEKRRKIKREEREGGGTSELRKQPRFCRSPHK